MQQPLTFIIDSFRTFSGDNPVFIIVLLAFLYILAAGGREGRCFFVWPVLFMLLTVFNPLFVSLFVKISDHEVRYHRLFWILPFYMIAGYACTLLIDQVKYKMLQGILFLFFSAAIVITGIPVFAGGEKIPDYRPAPNASFTSDDIRQLASIYHSEGIPTPKILYDQDLVLGYRMYDPDVTSYITREYLQQLLILPEEEYIEKARGETRKLVMRVYYYGDHYVEAATFAEAIQHQKIDYVTARKGSSLHDYLQNSCFELVGFTSSYEVWKVSTA